MFKMKEFKLELPHTKIDCISFGIGSQPLIMIQGLNTRGIKGAGASLAWLYRIFAKDYRVYFFDRREEVSDGLTVRDMAEDVAAAMDQLQLRHADILGVSQGGMIAQYLAIDRPDLVRKLVLAVTLSRDNDTVCSTVQRWIDLTEQNKMKELISDMAVKMYSDTYLKRYRPLLPLLTVLQKPRDIPRFLILAKACLGCNAYDELKHIQCPVLVIGGEQDQVVGAAASREIAEQLNCRIHMYEGLGHAAYEEAKDFNQRVYDFLQE